MVEKLNKYISKVENTELALEDRINALKKIEIHADQLIKISEFEKAIIMNLFSELKSEKRSDFVVHCMTKELRKCLYIPDVFEKTAVVLGKNWISDAMKDVLSKNYFYCIPFDKINWDLANSYKSFFFICDENEEFHNLLKRGNIDNKYIINICTLLDVGFLSSPSMMNIFNEFDLTCKKNDIEGLITGLSYGRDALHCDLLEKKTVTLANSGQDLYYDYLCLKYAYSKIPSLQYVISVIAPFSLRYDESLYKNHNQNILFYYGLFEDIHHNVDVLEKVKLYVKEKNKIDNIVEDWKKNTRQIYKEYFRPHYGRVFFDRKDIFLHEKDEFHKIEEEVKKLYKKPYEDTLIEYKNLLKRYCSFLVEKNIKLIFLIPPFTQLYKCNWDNDYYYELINYLQQMKDMFHVEYMDMTQMQLPDSCFRDSGHINRIGAIYVADMINRWLRDNGDIHRL